VKIAIDAKREPRDFAGMGGFKAHDPKLGHRLERQVGLGPAGLLRRFAPDTAVVVEGPAVAKAGRPRTIDGRFGKRLSGSAGATTGSG
jgi:hypothetical protein